MIAVHRNGGVLGYETPVRRHTYLPVTPPPVLQHPKGNMTVSQAPSSAAERRLAIARRLYQALVAQDPARAITLCDGGGGVVARHDPLPEQRDPEIAS